MYIIAATVMMTNGIMVTKLMVIVKTKIKMTMMVVFKNKI